MAQEEQISKEKRQIPVETIVKTALRIIIGAVFIFSAVAKLLSLDNFELYIYSFNLFSYNFSTFVARFVIAAELLAGILLITKIYFRKAWWLTMLMLAGFSLLLIYIIIFRDDTNCHCMGDIVQMKPSVSLIKNIVLMLLLLFLQKENDYLFKRKKLICVFIVILSFTIPYVVFPMDNIYNIIRKKEHSLNEAEFNRLLSDTTLSMSKLDSGNYIIGIISSGCGYCRISCTKMSEICTNTGTDYSKIIYFIWGDESDFADFQKDTKTEHFTYHKIDVIHAIRITNGHFPLYIYMKDGEIEKLASLRQISEKEVVKFLE